MAGGVGDNQFSENLASGHLEEGAHILPVRVYWEDTDAGGIVYHASYVRFFERGRTELLRALGCTQSVLQAEGVRFVVSKLDIAFRVSARLDDVLQIRTKPAVVGHAKLILAQDIHCEGQEMVRANVTCAAIDTADRPVRLPELLRNRIKAMQESDS